MKPSPDSVSLVNEFLSSHGVTAQTISPAGDWLSFSVPVSQANEMFDADFQVFEHSETGQQSVRTLAYSIPTELQGHLDLVHPTITYVLLLLLDFIPSCPDALEPRACQLVVISLPTIAHAYPYFVPDAWHWMIRGF